MARKNRNAGKKAPHAVEPRPQTETASANLVAARTFSRAPLILFGLMASLPLLQPFHNLPLPSFQTECLSILLGLIGCFLLLRRASESVLHIPVVASAPLLLAAVVFAQMLTGMFSYTENALLVLAYQVWAAMLIIAGRVLIDRWGAPVVVTLLAWCVLASGLTNALFGLLQYGHLSQAFNGLITEPMELSVHGIYGNLAQQNHFATHLALAMASAAYLGLIRKLSVASCLLAMAILLPALVLSGSRSGFLYVTLIGALVLLTSRLAARSTGGQLPRRIVWWSTGLLSLALLSLWLLARYAAIPQVARLTHFSAAFGPRMFLWQQAWAMFAAHPLMGVGFDGFAAQLVEQLGQLKMRNPWGIDQYAHNLFLQLMAVSGVVGLLAVALPTLLFLRRQAKLALTQERMWLCACLAIFAVHSMLEQPLYYAYFLGPAALLAGVADPSAWALKFPRPARSAASVLCILCTLLLVKTASDYDALQGYFFSDRHVAADESEKLQTLHSLHGFSLLSPLTELVAPQVFSPATSPAQEKIAFNRRVMRYAPTAETEFRHAVLLADAGQNQAAAKQFDQAAYAYPNDVTQYAERFAMLEARDPARYGVLAAHVRDFTTSKLTPTQQ